MHSSKRQIFTWITLLWVDFARGKDLMCNNTIYLSTKSLLIKLFIVERLDRVDDVINVDPQHSSAL